jgi:ferric-dicitrate binding protein FerR (iron transport regulator)
MTAKRHLGTTLMVCIVLVGATGQNPEPAALSVDSATIAELKGEVTLHGAPGDVLTAQRGTVLGAESKIDTAKGSVLLDLQDGSQVLVKPNSHVVLKSPSQDKGYWLELLLGKINAKVQKRLGNAPSFRMGTPTAVITVRGTRFSVEVNKKQKTSVEVFEGLVEVGGFAHGTPVLLRPGFYSGIERDRDPEQPRGIDNREMNENRSNPGWGGVGGRGEDDRQKPSTQPGTQNPDSPEHDHEREPN